MHHLQLTGNKSGFILGGTHFFPLYAWPMFFSSPKIINTAQTVLLFIIYVFSISAVSVNRFMTDLLFQDSCMIIRNLFLF